MRMRQVIAVTTVAVLALVAGACGGDDEKKADETTTTAKSTETTETSTTLDDADYTAQIAEYTSAVEAAGTDLCALSSALSTQPPAPGNSAQSKQLIELYAKLLRTLAATIPEDPTTVQTLNSTADALLQEAEAAGYPVDFLTNPETAPKSLTSEAFSAANTATAAKAQTQCASTSTVAGGETTTTVAG
jgi:hypothetical protein